MSNLYTIKFDDDNHTYDNLKGISLSQIAPLLSKLAKALAINEEDQIVLSEISGNCYQLGLHIPTATKKASFQAIHEAIFDNDFKSLSKNEKEYAKQLKEIQEKNGVWTEVKTPEQKVIAKIEKIAEFPNKSFYNEIRDVRGKVTLMGSADLDKKRLMKIGGKPYTVNINAKQEQQLIQHFKKSTLLFTLKFKIDLDTEKEETVTLIDFSKIADSSFVDNVIKLKEENKDKRFTDDSIEDTHSLL